MGDGTAMLHGGNVWQGGDPAKWLDFSANLRPDGMPDWVKTILLSRAEDARYYPDRGMRLAAEGIAAMEGVSPACVLPTPGGIAAIDLAVRVNGGRVMYMPPTFIEYGLRAKANGLAAAVCSGHSDLCPGDMLFLCNPNNPTGETLDRKAVLALWEKVREKGASLAVDEAFIHFSKGCSVLSDAVRQEGLYVTGSLTKILSVPGVRLGYLAAAPGVINRARALSLPWGLNCFAAALADAVRFHREDIKRDVVLNEERRRGFAALLTGIGACVKPSGANFLLADFGRSMAETSDRLKQGGVLVRTCQSFGLPDSFLRLAVKTEEQNLRLISALHRAWEEENDA